MESEVPVTVAAAGLILKADNETCYLWLQTGSLGPHTLLDSILLSGHSSFGFTVVLTFYLHTEDRTGREWRRVHWKHKHTSVFSKKTANISKNKIDLFI